MLLVSGGQTGVDRAALEVAAALGIDYAGFCPRNGWAEDLRSPPGLLGRYPRMIQTVSSDPAVRTKLNARLAEATLLLRPSGSESPGSDLTVSLAAKYGRLLVLDPDDLRALPEARLWVSDIRVLNVAGPRESESPGIEEQSKAFLFRLLAPELH
jgi:hypothetical protein